RGRSPIVQPREFPHLRPGLGEQPCRDCQLLRSAFSPADSRPEALDVITLVERPSPRARVPKVATLTRAQTRGDESDHNPGGTRGNRLAIVSPEQLEETRQVLGSAVGLYLFARRWWRCSLTPQQLGRRNRTMVEEPTVGGNVVT